MTRIFPNAVKGLMTLALLGSLAATASAQFTITIPKLPKIKKTQPQPTPTTPASDEQIPVTTSSGNSTPTSVAKSYDCATDSWVGVHMEDIEDTRKEAEEFRPGLRDYYVSTLSDRKNLYLEAAVSPWIRKNWFKDSNQSADQIKCMNAALDNLAAVARKTLPTYTGPSGYTFGTPAEKKALLSAIDDIAQAKVLKVGIKQANWLIAKDDYNFPTARYKHGVIWAKYPNYDDGYCRIFWVNIKQDYAGGGTYGASYGYFVSRAIAGCPAGK